ncbi:MAG: GAF domain-containing protein [Anaerolineales bacterium]
MIAASPTAVTRGRGTSIRTRLILILLPLVLLGVVLTGAASYLRAREIVRQQVDAQLVSAVEAETSVLTEWIQTREQRLTLSSQRPSLRAPLVQLMAGTGTPLEARQAREVARAELEALKAREGTIFFNDLLVVRLSDGVVLASTQPGWENVVFDAVLQARIPAEAPVTAALFDDPLLSPGVLSMVSSIPFRAASTQAADSLLIGVNGGLRLATLMDAMQVFWEERGVYRVERGRTFLLVQPDLEVTLPQYAVAPLVIAGQDHPAFGRSGSDTAATLQYEALDGQPVLSAFQWLEPTGMAVVVELPQSDVFAGLNTLAPFILAVLVGVSALTALVVALAAGQILRPLGDLTQFAERLSQGDLGHRVESTRPDEIGRLASTLNFMADELSGFYTTLEKRVEDRTRQIRTAADVAKEAAAIRNVDQLLSQTVNVISARFGFYHAGVFLLDGAGEFAVLRAASSPGGKRLLARGHKLPVGKVGLVGYVTGTGNPRVALDVGSDAVHFANPELPDTRSELALPLRAGEQLIGALDVQTVEPNGFGEEDVLVLQTMADQLAVAIENARLLEEATRLATQRRSVLDLYQSLTRQAGYDQLLAVLPQELRRVFGFRSVSVGLREGDHVVIRSASAVDQASLPHIGESIPVGRGALGRAVAQQTTVLLPAEASQGSTGSFSTLAVPLISRGRALGALSFESDGPSDALQREAENLELLAGQAAVSIENARLIEETQQSLRQLDALYRQQTASAWSERLASLDRQESLTQFQFGPARNGEGEAEGSLEAALQVRGEVIGTLSIEPARPGEWSEEEAEILRAVADEVAGALEQVRLMEEVQQRAAQLQAAAEIARESTAVLNEDTLLTRAIGLIRERIGLPTASILLLDGEGGLKVVGGESGAPLSVSQVDAHQLDDLASLLLNRVSQIGKTEILSDLASIPGASLGVGAALGVPLRAGTRVIGLLRIDHDTPHAFRVDDIAVFEVIADQLAVAVQNARLFEQTLHRAEREQSVVEITNRIRASADPEAMLQTALREMRGALGARRGRVIRHAPEFRPGAASDSDLPPDGDGKPR